MPLYVYSCPECDVLLEELRPLGAVEWPPVECPVCHGLCQPEVTSASITGVRGPMDGYPQAFEENNQNAGDPVGVMHGPGCPCCRTV